MNFTYKKTDKDNPFYDYFIYSIFNFQIRNKRKSSYLNTESKYKNIFFDFILLFKTIRPILE